MEDTETGIHDKGFCHGVSGVYYIYKKLNDILIDYPWEKNEEIKKHFKLLDKI